MYELLRNKWDHLSRAARYGLAVGLLAIFMTLVLGSYWLLNEQYQVLFSDLNPQDASAMVAELDRMKVPYRLAEGGTAILVEQENVYKTRLKLMGKGLDLRGGVGFEIFNNADFGMTEFAQKVNYQRALQGELARTLMGFEEVKSARVHLVLPESGLLKRQGTQPKASISLTMKGSSRLLPEQISGIQRLVAASVPEIDASAVTIIDQHGVAVSKASADEVGSNLSGKLDAKRQVEDYLTRKLVSVLDRAVGPGRAIVSIDVSLNYDQIKITKDEVLPLAGSSESNAGAVVRRKDSFQGADANEPFSASGVTQNKAQGLFPSASSSEVEFANGRRVEQVVSSPGGIRRLSIGIMVPDLSDPVELAKLKEVVAMAAGITPARGDAIVVYGLPGAAGREDSATKEMSAQQDLSAPITIQGRNSVAETWLPSSPLTLMGGGIAFLILALLHYRQRQKYPSHPARLTSEQREQLLEEISRWAATEKA